MHRGTPVLMDGDRLYIYHKGGTEGSDRLKFFNVSSGEIQVKIKSAWAIHTIDGKDFDPASMISYDWHKVLPPDMYLRELNVTHVGKVAERSKYLHLLRMAPIDWPRKGKRKELDTDVIATWDPLPCLFHPGTSQVMADGYSIDDSYRGADINGYDQDDIKGTMTFDPKLTVQKWQIDTVKAIEAALAKYERKVSGVGEKNTIQFKEE